MRLGIVIVAVAVALASLSPRAAVKSDVPRIIIAGDSTASEYGPERAPRAGWGMALPSYFGAYRDVRNRALSGRSSRSFIEQGALDAIAKELRSGDVLLIQFGHNDEKREDPTRYTEAHADFPRWLLRYVTLARERGAKPVLITPLARRVFDHGQLLDTHGVYAEAVRELARRERVDLIDLTALSMDWLRALGDDASKAYYQHVTEQNLQDDTHLQWHGATAVACLIVARWKALDPDLARHVVRDTSCTIPPTARSGKAGQPQPSMIIRDGTAAGRSQPGPHGGNGLTTAFLYFEDAVDLPLQFRKRALPRGAGIGLHLHDKDEIYYVLTGRGRYVLDGVASEVAAGDVMLTRSGSTHALQQIGDEELVILITYLKAP